MTYCQYREAMVAAYYSGQLTGLISRFDPTKETVFLLPGGMGSGLNRTDQKYPAPSPNVFDYQVWVGPQTIFGGNAPYLQIDQNLADGQQYVVGAEGPISILGLSAYDTFISHGRQEWNFLILK